MAGGTTAMEADCLVVLAGTNDIERGVSFGGDDVHPTRTGAQLTGEALRAEMLDTTTQRLLLTVSRRFA